MGNIKSPVFNKTGLDFFMPLQRCKPWYKHLLHIIYTDRIFLRFLELTGCINTIDFFRLAKSLASL